jgi:prolyl oligopeptidase
MIGWLLCVGILVSLALPARADESEDSELWLEEVTGDRPLAWVREQNEQSTRELASATDFQALDVRLLKILDSEEKIPFIEKAGPHFYNFWRDAEHQRGVWRRTSLEEHRRPRPAWEVVLDIDALGRDEGENWVWKGAAFLRPACKRCLVHLSRGGADASVVREFDLTSKTFVRNGFTLPEAKSNIGWRDRNSLFVGTDFGPGSLTDSGYPRLVKEWRRGTPIVDASLVFEGRPEDVSVHGYRTHTPGYRQDFVSRGVTFWENELFLRRDGQLIPIRKPADANAFTARDLLLIELRSAWTIGDHTYAAGALLAADLEEFLQGKREFAVLFEPTERTSLTRANPSRRHILLSELDNVRTRLSVLTRKGSAWRRESLPGVPPNSSASAWAVDADVSDDYFLSFSDYLTPPTLSYGTVGQGPAEKLKQGPAFFNTEGLAVSQHEAVSKDGTRVPYFQVSRAELAADGRNPTLLYGYGGFEIPLTPGYNPIAGAAWMERGGVYVVANIRGGGEFGPRWHQAALKANRPRAYEDFIAVAEDLIRRGVTSPAHLGIMGGSNGGLLVGNMLTMRPDLFGAVVCQVPLLDMRRYHKLLAGASWVAEFGNPDDPEEWEFIQTFSPYHNLRSGVTYPRTLFLTSTRDDRVHPGHARKMVAKMKAQGHDVLYYENIEGGHGGAADNKQAAFMSALAYTFLWSRLQPSPGV